MSFLMRVFISFLLLAPLGCGDKTSNERPENKQRKDASKSSKTSKTPNEENKNPKTENQKPKSTAEKFIEAVEQDRVSEVEQFIADKIMLLADDLGVQALEKSKNPQITKVIVEKMFGEFKESYKETSGDKSPSDDDVFRHHIFNENKEQKYDLFVRKFIQQKRAEVGDAQLLADFAWVPQSFKFMRDLGVDLNTIAKPTYGVLNDDDAGPLMVMLTALGPLIAGRDGNSMIELAQELLAAGADINAVDRRGHTALYYAELGAKAGHDWQKKPYRELKKWLRERGGVST